MNWWIMVGKKVIETIISVKVLVIFTVLLVSTNALYAGLIAGGAWAGLNGGVISTVFALREAFKVNKIKSDTQESKDTFV